MLGSCGPLRADQLSITFLTFDIELRGIIVNNLDHPVLSQHDVGRLEITMDDRRLRAVQKRQPITELCQDPDAFLKRQTALFLSIKKDLLQSLSLNQFLNDDQFLSILPERFDPRHIAAFVIPEPAKNFRVIDCKPFPVKQLSGSIIPDD